MRNIDKLAINNDEIIFKIENTNLHIRTRYPRIAFLIFYLIFLLILPTLWINLMISKSVIFAFLLPFVWLIIWGVISLQITGSYNSIIFDIKKRIVTIKNIDFIGKFIYKTKNIDFNFIENVIIEDFKVAHRNSSIKFREVKIIDSNNKKINLFRFIDGGYLSKYEFEIKELISYYINK